MQNIFNTMLAGMIAQNAFGYNPDLDTCQYFAPDGRRCAVGQLAASDEIAKEWEENELSVEQVAANIGVTDKRTIELMGAIQAEHDYHARHDPENAAGEADFEQFINEVRKIGACFSLNIHTAFTK